MNDFIELRRVVAIVLKRWWLILLIVAIITPLGYAYSRRQPPVYQATSTLLVGQFMQSTNLSKADIQTSEGFAQTYADLALRQPVLEGVITQLNLKENWQKLQQKVTVKSITGTQLIEITAEANSPQLASNIANAIGDQLIANSPTKITQDSQGMYTFTRKQLDRLQQRIIDGQNRLQEIDTTIQGTSSQSKLDQLNTEKTTLEEQITSWEKNYIEMSSFVEQQSVPNNYLTMIEKAEANPEPIRPRVGLNTILSAFLGIVLGLGLIFILEGLGDTYQSLEDLYQLSDLNILGVIERIKGKKWSDKIITYQDPYSSLVESYRMVRSRIQLFSGDHLTNSLMVTSALPGEGKTITASNLALVFAQGGVQTILVDLDFRNPSLHHLFNLDNGKGLIDLLSSKQSVEEVIGKYLNNTTSKNLKIMTSGKLNTDSSERISSERMEEVLISLQEKADLVIFDCPPALLAAENMILSKMVDGVVLVIRAGKAKRSEVRQVLDDLQTVGAHLYGCVFNQGKSKISYANYRNHRTGWLYRLKTLGKNKSSRVSRHTETVMPDLVKIKSQNSQ